MGWEISKNISEFTNMKNSERRCKLSEYFWAFLKNVVIRIKIMRKVFIRGSQ